MDVFTLVTADGCVEAVPMLRFKFNFFDKQTYVLIGTDTSHGPMMKQAAGFTAERLGRLSELRESLRLEITDHITYRWPMDDYPDPDVIMVTAPRPAFN